MAKVKAVKLIHFFEGRRRKASLVAWTHLKTKAGESRVKLDLRLPLLNEPLLGMDGTIGEAFAVMAKEDSRIDRTTLNVTLEGMTLEMFSTGDVKIPAVSSTGVKMVKLALVAAGETEKRTLDLVMVAYVPASIRLRDWAWDHLHSAFHLEAVYSQSEMDFGASEEDEDAGEEATDLEGADGELDPDNEEEEPPIPAPASKPLTVMPRPKPRKSGPRELAAFHAAQRPN